MMSVNRVSVVIPAYNAEAYLCQAVESVLAQQDVTVQVIVVDDGSTDGTPACAATFGEGITYVAQQNAGPVAARNRGLSLCECDWVAFLDADDVWEPEKLHTQLYHAQQSDADFVFSNAFNIGDVEHVAPLRYTNRPPEGDLFRELLMDNFIVLSSVLLRKDVLDQCGGFREEFVGVEDWELWLRIASSGARFASVMEPLVHYRWRHGSFSKNHHRMRRMRELLVRTSLATPAGERLNWIQRQNAIAGARATSAWFATESAPADSLKWYGEAIASTPWNVNLWYRWMRQQIRITGL